MAKPPRRWRRVRLVLPVDSMIQSSVPVVEQEIEVFGWHQFAHDLMNARVEVVQVLSGMNGLGDLPGRVLDLFATLARLLRPLAVDRHRGLFGDEHQQLLLVFAEGVRVLIVLHGHDSDRFTVNQERNAQPDRRRRTLGEMFASLD